MRQHPAVALLLLMAAAASGAEPRDPATPTIVYALRHAEKGGAPGEKDPPLSAAGAVRARTLAHMLAEVKFDAIYVSSYRRTQETVAPLAQAQGLTPVVLAPDSVAAHILRRDEGKTVLVVGHSNTVPAVLTGLGSGLPVTIADTQFDHLFIVLRTPHGVSVQHLHYGMPDPPAPVLHPATTSTDTSASQAPRR